MMLLILTSGDIEDNPDPPIEQMLQTVLDNRAKSDHRLNAISEEISALNIKTDQLVDILEVVEEMKVRVVSLEITAKYQAAGLTELENRSRRNNLLVFIVEERSKESEADLKKAIVNDIFGKQGGIEVKSIERMHRIG